MFLYKSIFFKIYNTYLAYNINIKYVISQHTQDIEYFIIYSDIFKYKKLKYLIKYSFLDLTLYKKNINH